LYWSIIYHVKYNPKVKYGILKVWTFEKVDMDRGKAEVYVGLI